MNFDSSPSKAKRASRGGTRLLGGCQMRAVSRLCSGCALRTGTLCLLRQILQNPTCGKEVEQEAPGAVSWLPVSEGPWTRARVLAKTTWIVPAAFSWEGRGYVPPGQEKDGGPFGYGWGSAPRGIAACVLRVCVPLSQAMPN